MLILACVVLILAYIGYSYHKRQMDNETILRIYYRTHGTVTVDTSHQDFQRSIDILDATFDILSRLEEKQKTMSSQQAEDQVVAEIKAQISNSSVKF